LPDSKNSPKGISPKKLSNLKVVVLCIAAATTFWILNALNKDDYTTIVDFPIELNYDKEEYIPVERLPESLQIQISGNGWDLLRKYFNFNSNPYPIELDNPAGQSYLLTNNFTRQMGDFLTPTQLISILDDSLKYRIDRIETIELVPVLDSLSYSLATNYKILEEVKFDPPTIEVTGASSILDSLNDTIQVNLAENRLNQDIEKTISLSLPEEYENLARLKNGEITVKVDVVAFLEGNKRLKIKKINFPRNVTLEDEEITIMMYYLVDERNVSDLREIEFEAILDYTRRNREDSTMEVSVQPMPKYLEQVRVEPEILKLIYE